MSRASAGKTFITISKADAGQCEAPRFQDSSHLQQERELEEMLVNSLLLNYTFTPGPFAVIQQASETDCPVSETGLVAPKPTIHASD